DKIAPLRVFRTLPNHQLYHRVNNGFKLLPRFGAFENEFPHGLAVESPGGRNDIGAEMLPYGFDGGASGRGEFVGNDVGVDDGRAPFREKVGHPAFTGTDAAREADFVHKARFCYENHECTAVPCMKTAIPPKARLGPNGYAPRGKRRRCRSMA